LKVFGSHADSIVFDKKAVLIALEKISTFLASASQELEIASPRTVAKLR
jgi:hypothetical protein